MMQSQQAQQQLQSGQTSQVALLHLISEQAIIIPPGIELLIMFLYPAGKKINSELPADTLYFMTFKTSRKTIIVILLFIGLVSGTGVALANKMEKVIRFQQTSALFGEVELLLSKDSVRINCMRGTCRVVGKGPAWNVQVYNSKDKRGFLVSASQWNDKGMNLGGFSKPFKKRRLILDREKKLGLNLVRSTVPMTDSAGGFNGLFRSGTRKAVPAKSITFTAVEKLSISQGQRDIIRGFYQSPAIGDVPYAVSIARPDGSIDNPLKTNSWQYKQVPVNTFDFVSSFKRAPSVEATMFGTQFESMMEDFMLPAGR